MNHTAYTSEDFGRSPLMFYYEVTLACDLVCKHCRASAQEQPDAGELSTAAAKALLDQAASFPRPPQVVLTGGDPLKRPDLVELIRHAAGRGLSVALTPSATPLATREALEAVRRAGVRALGISLDGADAATHDAFRGWEGSFHARCGCWPTPANSACPSRSTPRSLAATSARSIGWPNCWPEKASPCGRCSFWCRWAAASRRSASGRKSTRWSSRSFGAMPAGSPTR